MSFNRTNGSLTNFSSLHMVHFLISLLVLNSIDCLLVFWASNLPFSVFSLSQRSVIDVSALLVDTAVRRFGEIRLGSLKKISFG